MLMDTLFIIKDNEFWIWKKVRNDSFFLHGFNPV